MQKKEYDFELLFRALADRTRLRVINLIGDEEVCVCFLVEALNSNQPKISRHLAYLRRAGLVSSRRDGKWIHYRVCEPGNTNAARVFAEVRDWLASTAEMHDDKIRFEKLCCAPQLPGQPLRGQPQKDQLQKAPRPTALGA